MSATEVENPIETTALPEAVLPPVDDEMVSAATLPFTADSTHSRRIGKPLAIAIIVVAILIMVGYIVAGDWRKGPAVESVRLYTVVPRSFPVILQQKGELKSANLIEIRSEIEGRATIISLVPEGTLVKKGDLLVELASDETDDKIRDAEIKEATARAAYEAAAKGLEITQDANASQIRKTELDLHLAELALEKFTKGEAVQSRQVAKLAFEKAKSILERANANLVDSEQLFKQSFLTRLELENDRFTAYEADLEVKKANLALEVLEKYTIPMELSTRESAVTEAKKECERTRKSASATEAKLIADVGAKKSEFDLVQEKLAKLRDQKAKSKILAPADGLVVYARGDSWWRSETQIEKGATVHERQSLIELPDTTSMKVVIRVHEAQTEKLRLGLPANVEIEGFSGRIFSGKISKIAVLADSQNRYLNPNLKEYETEILLDGEFTELKPGITARAEILVAQVENALAVPVQCVFAKGKDYYVFLDQGGTGVPAKVEVGMASNEYVEIKSGLRSQQNVYLAVTDEMKLKLPEGENASVNHSPKGKKPDELPAPPPSTPQKKEDSKVDAKGEKSSR